jgi:hypothetical protein
MFRFERFYARVSAIRIGYLLRRHVNKRIHIIAEEGNFIFYGLIYRPNLGDNANWS